MTFAAVQLRPSFSSTSPAEEVLKSKGTAFHQHPYHFAGVKPVNLVWDKKLVSTIFDARLEEESFERKLFEALISLKVVTAQYAMHLSADERHRLFDELDRLINFDDWHEEDTLPSPTSYQEFLKWMIHAKRSSWTSMGVSAEGNIQVAWLNPHVTLTANFEGKNSVRWTAQVRSEQDEVGLSAGKCSLRLFAEQALFYLRDESGQVEEPHS